MTDNIHAIYDHDGVHVILSVGEPFSQNDSLPYDLAQMFRRIIDDSGANPQIVIDELEAVFGRETFEDKEEL